MAGTDQDTFEVLEDKLKRLRWFWGVQ